ncbi:MAG: hydroxymethylglutaryl-CoA lyase [Planctomycetota bacterium]
MSVIEPNPPRIAITEVGPRDGLQNESRPISTADKIRFIDALSLTGLTEIEVTSFVSPKAIPQLGDAVEVMAGIQRNPEVTYSALVPNVRGLEGALRAECDKVAVFTAASEQFNQRNINASIRESVERFRPVVEQALDAGVSIRGYVSCVVACPYQGFTKPDSVAEVVRMLIDLGIDEIDLGETVGVAVPSDIERLYDEIGKVIHPQYTTLHLHDTRGTALSCLIQAYLLGVRSFDTSAGGLGGCPFAPGAAGNVATEDVIFAFNRMGIYTGIDLDALFRATRIIAEVLDRRLPGRVFRADGTRAAGGPEQASFYHRFVADSPLGEPGSHAGAGGSRTSGSSPASRDASHTNGVNQAHASASGTGGGGDRGSGGGGGGASSVGKNTGRNGSGRSGSDAEYDDEVDLDFVS